MNTQTKFFKKSKTLIFQVIFAGLLSLALAVTGSGQKQQAAAKELASTVGEVDTFPGKIINSIPFDDTVDTTSATSSSGDPNSIKLNDCDSNQGEKSVWYHYTPTTDISLYVDTIGSTPESYDTVLAVWKGDPSNLTLVACNDDISTFEIQSKVGFFAKAGTTYYIEVIEWVQNAPTTLSAQAGGSILNLHIEEGDFSIIDVHIGGVMKGNYAIPGSQSLILSYELINNGPVELKSTNGIPIIASNRVGYSPDGGVTWTNHSEMMGMPEGQLTNVYWFPFYNSLQLNTFLSFSNVGTAPTSVTVTIGENEYGPYDLDPDEGKKIKYGGLNTGPVKVEGSDPNVPIIASERISYAPPGDPFNFTSFSELMGMPEEQLTNVYWFPFYNSLQLNTFLSFSNVGMAPTSVTVMIGENEYGPYLLDPGDSEKIKYGGLNTGPVKVEGSDPNVPIIASERISYAPPGDPFNFTSFNELMGMPDEQLTNINWFPWYNSTQFSTFLSFSNVGTVPTSVTVMIGENAYGPYALDPGDSEKIKYGGLNTGPVKVEGSDPNVPIIASSRVSYAPPGDPFNFISFSEMLGMPTGLLADTYVFPWYNNLQLDSELRIGVP